MRRYLALLGGLLGLLLFSGLTVAVCSDRHDQNPVYSIAQVEAKLTRQPESWLGRTVRLRAIAEPCPIWWRSPYNWLHCRSALPVLVDQEGSLTDPLLLLWRQQSPLIVFLRSAPLLDQIVPTVHMLVWGAPATFHVQLLAAHATNCMYVPCYEALLLDAAP